MEVENYKKLETLDTELVERFIRARTGLLYSSSLLRKLVLKWMRKECLLLLFISILARLHHKNLLSLVGYCYEGRERILIYEYMDYGSLRNLLQRDSDAEHLLNWETRLGIALSTAQGLEYLHSGCRPCIIHKDIKTANILINETHITIDVKGTFGYLNPQYVKARILREKSDFYSFGVVILEIISERPMVDPATELVEHAYVLIWTQSILKTGDVKGIINRRARGSISVNALWKVVELTMMCIEQDVMNRPTTTEAVAELEEAIKVIRISNSSSDIVPSHSLDRWLDSIPCPR